MASTSASVLQRNQEATLYVGQVDDAADEELLWELFVQAGPVVSVHMPRDKVSGRHQNYAFVELRSEEDADYAVKVLNMTRLFGKLLRVSRSAGEKGAPGGGGGGPGASEGVGANLFIGNLDPEVDEKILYDTFSAFGTIAQPPKVMRDLETGASKGFGFVSFDSFEGADLAIGSMHGQFLCNRQVGVQYAFRKDSRSERHGSAAERHLAASARANRSAVAQARPNILFATAAGGAILSAVPASVPGSGRLGGRSSFMAPPPMLPPVAILPAGLDALPPPGAPSAASATASRASAPAQADAAAAAGYAAHFAGESASASASGGVGSGALPPPLPPQPLPPPLPYGAPGGQGAPAGYGAPPPPLPMMHGGAYFMPPPFPHYPGAYPQQHGMPPPQQPPPFPQLMQQPPPFPYGGGPPPYAQHPYPMHQY